MEQNESPAQVQSNQENEIQPEKNGNEFKELFEIFGTTAEIKRGEEGGFVVETVLEDGIASGKQKLRIELSDVKEVTKVEARKKVKACRAERLIVNGVNLEGEIPAIFFELRPQSGKVFKENPTLGKDELQEEMKKEANPLMRHALRLFGTATAFGSKSIFMTVFSTADDLISLFHEVGHILDPQYFGSEYKLTAFAHAFDKSILSVDGTIQADRFAAIKRWKFIMEREVAANNNGLIKIGELREKVDLFPNDPDLLRVRKSFEFKTMSYLGMANSWFSKQITPAMISKMMNMK